VLPQDRPEVEWHLEALDLRPVERWIGARREDASPSLVPKPTVSLVDTYLDTPDWRLHRAGFSLRLRQNDGEARAEATLKVLDPPEEGLRTRREITEPLAKADPTLLARARGPVGERIRVLAARGPLEVLLEIRTTRRRYALVEDDVEIGELALDHTAIPVEGDDVPIVMQRVEVESAGERNVNVDAFARAIRDACRLNPAGNSKFESGLLARGLSPPDPIDLGPTDVDRTNTTGEVAFASLRTQFAEVLAHEPGARLGEDPEEVHDVRVATRRMRAALKLFEPALPARGRWLRKELGWIARSFGAVRDLDVQIEQTEEWLAEATDEEDRKALEPLVRILEKRRRQARRRLIRDLDSRRYRRLVERTIEVLRRGPLPRSTAARQLIVSVAPDMLAKPYRRVRREGDRLRPASSPAEFHSLRIRCKRLRYALEFLSPIAPKESKAFVKSLVTVQDVLGEHQDAQVAMGHIRELVAESGHGIGTQTVFALGRIAERYDRRAEELRGKFPAAYRELKGGAWKDVERAMGRAREERAGEEATRRVVRASPAQATSAPGA